MRLPIGYDNFYNVIENKFDFVDKSLLIKDIIDDTAEVILITRPRRFGKTFNLSMVQHFFSANVHGHATEKLFENLKITQIKGNYLEYQGKRPVIALTFKDVKETDFKSAYNNMSNLIRELYAEHRGLLETDILHPDEKKIFQSILDQNAAKERVQTALKDLTQYLSRQYNVKPLVLIDEYDTPIHAGYTYGYYEEITSFLRNFFSSALKGNPHLYKAVLTGIMRIAKESLFSGLNNLEIYSLLRPEYGSYFGFTEDEVSELLSKTKLNPIASDFKHWYNGYQVNNIILYNPWSVVNCIKRNGELRPYWINTSDNAVVQNLLTEASIDFKSYFEILLKNGSIEKIIDENFIFPDLKKNESAIWSLLLMTGYLKIVEQRWEKGLLCKVQIPNQEIKELYQTIIQQWLSNGRGVEWYSRFLNDLLVGNVKNFSDNLEVIMLQMASVHDLSKEPEAFYHGLMLGLTASLEPNQYEVKSNRESGLGRYDIMIIPKDVQKLGIIIEIKNLKMNQNTGNIENTENSVNIENKLKQAAQNAIQQIQDRGYHAELLQRGIKNILLLGLAFCGKRFTVISG